MFVTHLHHTKHYTTSYYYFESGKQYIVQQIITFGEPIFHTEDQDLITELPKVSRYPESSMLVTHLCHTQNYTANDN